MMQNEKRRRLIDDAGWTRGRGPVGLQIALATFGILALELALIRWVSSQVRIFAYFNNLILIGAFLGMGLGLALGRRRPGLIHLTLPVLAAVSAVLAFAPEIGLHRIRFPDASTHFWGAGAPTDGLSAGASLAIFFAIFLVLSSVFLFAGAAVGHLFSSLPPLRAYGWDLFGSLLGIGAISAATLLNSPPPVWLAIGAAPFAWLSRRPLSLIGFVAAVALGWASIDGALYSPYNRIDLLDELGSKRLSVNRDFHQHMHDLSPTARRDVAPASAELERAPNVDVLRAAYDLPFALAERRGRALVVGAGSGNDVAAALRQGFGEVVSVDIDGVILDLGRRLHPERPYSDPRATTIVNDARAHFEQYDGPPFDVIAYGLLDSHAMFSSLSSLRLDNYVYTEEGIRAAWRLVGEGGLLSVSFSIFGGAWIGDRIYWTIAKATGVEPLAIYHNVYYGCTFVAARDPNRLNLQAAEGFELVGPSTDERATRTTSDDWPFLYVRPGVFPWGYLIVLACIVLTAAVATPLAFGRRALGSDFDAPLFFMGAAFLLIETRAVTSMSLLFGSTWLVNSAVFAGAIVMALGANFVAIRFAPKRQTPWLAMLLAATLTVWAIRIGALNALPLATRGAIGGLINALPIGLAGVIVSMRLARAANPAAALGSNLLGSVVGGCLEYFSMAVGLRALALLALGLYLLALLFILRADRGRPASPSF